MNINAGYEHEECNFGIVSDVHAMKTVVIENTLVYSFSAGTILIDVLVFLASSRNRPEISWIILHEGINNSSE